jgi:molybdopterin synthase sulfur carrier subunit
MAIPVGNLYPLLGGVKLFAAYEEAYGLSELKLEFPIINSRIASPRTPECLTPTVLTMGARTRERYQPGICPRPTPLQNGDEVVLIPPVGSPPVPSDTRPRAIGLSPGGRSS